MKTFTDLDVRYLNGRTWLLLRSFSFTHLNEPPIVVPAGFVTDFASTPRLFWRVFPPTGRYGKPAVVHDYLYRFGSVPSTNKPQADRIFLGAMKLSGCGYFTRTALYLAVRFFGGASFHAKRVSIRGV